MAGEELTLKQIAGLVEDLEARDAAQSRLADLEAARQLAREPGVHTLIGGTAISRVTPMDIIHYTTPASVPLVDQQTTL